MQCNIKQMIAAVIRRNASPFEHIFHYIHILLQFTQLFINFITTILFEFFNLFWFSCINIVFQISPQNEGWINRIRRLWRPINAYLRAILEILLNSVKTKVFAFLLHFYCQHTTFFIKFSRKNDKIKDFDINRVK